MLFDDHVIDKSVNDGGVRAARERGSAPCLFVCLQMISQLAAEAMEEALAQGVVVVGGTKGVIEWAEIGLTGGSAQTDHLGTTILAGEGISEAVILGVVGVILEVVEETLGVVGEISVEVGDLEEVQEILGEEVTLMKTEGTLVGGILMVVGQDTATKVTLGEIRETLAARGI